MKLFDDIFRRNVDKAFSDYNAEHLVDEAWNSFIAARKKEHKPGAGFPLWAKAASIALIIGTAALIGYLVINRESTNDTLTVSGTESDKETPATKNSEPENPNLQAISEMSEPVKGDEDKGNSTGQPEKTVSEQPAEMTHRYNDVFLAHIDTSFLPILAEYKFQLSEDSINNIIEGALKKFEESEPEETVSEEEVKQSDRTTFLAGVSGLLAQVDNAPSSPPGVLVGFYLEQKITKRISFRPGLALAINSLGIDNRSAQNNFAYSIPFVGGNSGTLSSSDGQLSLLAMELPLNIVFNVFKRGRSGIYLAAGTSTIFYFSQQFTGDFVNEYTLNSFDETSGLWNSETRYSTVTVNNSYGALSRTDFFGLANLSAGYSLPYGKSGTMLIEPFLQLPVSDLTSLNLRVRYGGLSIKIRFGRENNNE